jgi:hypothetical protein
MPQPKQYKNAAQKQAAYRARRPKPITQASLARLARTLNWVIRQADEHGCSPLPRTIIAEDAEQTLKNLICFLDPVKDTVRHPNWNQFHPDRAHEPDCFDAGYITPHANRHH